MALIGKWVVMAVDAAGVALRWCLKALVWCLKAEDRLVERQINDLRRHPGFDREAEEAVRLDREQGGRRNMHRVLDKYGVPDDRWFK